MPRILHFSKLVVGEAYSLTLSLSFRQFIIMLSSLSGDPCANQQLNLFARELRPSFLGNNLDGSMQIVSEKGWPEFSRKQIELLVGAGISRQTAEHYYELTKR